MCTSGISLFVLLHRPPPLSTRTGTLSPDPTLFRSQLGLGQLALRRAGRRGEHLLHLGRRAVGDHPQATALVQLRQRRVERHPAAVEIGRATSEPQSLMRISYAVFCLKKKTKTKE